MVRCFLFQSMSSTTKILFEWTRLEKVENFLHIKEKCIINQSVVKNFSVSVHILPMNDKNFTYIFNLHTASHILNNVQKQGNHVDCFIIYKLLWTTCKRECYKKTLWDLTQGYTICYFNFCERKMQCFNKQMLQIYDCLKVSNYI